MRAALDGARATGPTAVPRVRRPSLVSVAVLVPAGVLVAAAVFFGGGSDDGPIFPLGAGAVFVVGAYLAAASLGRVGWPRLGAPALALVACLVGFVFWSGLSVLWSIQPDRSWNAFNRGVLYLALLGLGACIASVVPRAPRFAATGLAGILALAIAWALAGKVVPALGPELERSARLRAPVGYWNALALLVAMSLPLWLWLAARRPHARFVRAGSTAMLAAAVVALVLTTSRGGILVGAIAVAAWLALAHGRLDGVAALLIATPVGALVAAWALSRPGLAEAGATAERARHDGALFGAVLVAALAAVFALASFAVRAESRWAVDEERRRLLARLATALVALGVALGLVAGVVRVGEPASWVRERIDEFRNPPSEQVTQGPERLTAFSSNNRWTWWGEAAEIFADRPVAGTGAGTFALARRPLRHDTQVPLAPHNVGLQALSETGVVGFLLLAGAAAAAAWAVGARLRRLEGGDRAAAAALAAALVAYLAHSLVDMGWEYVAVSGPFFVALGVLVGEPRERAARRRSGLLPALAAVALAATAVASLAFPWLAEQRIDDAYAALEQGRAGPAARAADDAAALNPVSVEPLLVGAAAAELGGDLDAAERLLRDAVELQPENPETWYELGRFEFVERGELGPALRHLDRSYALDSFGPSGPVLDAVRAEIVRRSAS